MIQLILKNQNKIFTYFKKFTYIHEILNYYRYNNLCNFESNTLVYFILFCFILKYIYIFIHY